jgi:hypothetical protein
MQHRPSGPAAYWRAITDWRALDAAAGYAPQGANIGEEEYEVESTPTSIPVPQKMPAMPKPTTVPATPEREPVPA